jgi:glucan phosphoethanolaminetransferase (alkaline phosphatase superfamily)
MSEEKKRISIKIKFTLGFIFIFLYFLIGLYSVNRNEALSLLVTVTIAILIIYFFRWLTALIRNIKYKKLSWAITIILGILSGPVALIIASIIVHNFSTIPSSPQSWNRGCQSSLQGIAVLYYMFLASVLICIISIIINIREKQKKRQKSI